MTVSDLWVLMSLFRSVILLPLIGNRQTLKQSSTKNNIKTVKPMHNNHKNVKSLIHQVIRHSKDRRLQQQQAESLFSVNTADFVFTLHFILFYFIFYGHLLLIHSEVCCFCSVCLHVLDQQSQQEAAKAKCLITFINERFHFLIFNQICQKHALTC